ncbi:MAG: hypothetical protein HZA88_06710 [Verrucomicrobia bacterium]|nr:hypothetical protein [Verrucomicrobiota bacterium]
MLHEKCSSGVLDLIRQRPTYVFHEGSFTHEFTDYQLGRFLGFERKDQFEHVSLVNALSHLAFPEFKSFTVKFDEEKYSMRARLCIGLKENAEWCNVLDEAWSHLSRANPPHLTDNANQLLRWARQRSRPENWVARSTLGRQAGLRGTSWTSDLIKTHLDEIRRKTDATIRYENKQDEFRIWFESNVNSPLEVGPINPSLEFSFKDPSYREWEQFERLVYSIVKETTFPDGHEWLVLFRIQDRRTLKTCFPKWDGHDKDLWNFFGQAKLQCGLALGYSFQDPNPWTIHIGPKQGTDWPKVKAAIHAKETSPSLEQKYGLSGAAGQLLRWIERIAAADGTLTPTVEDHLHQQIGLDPEWDRNNLPAYIVQLVEEINENTDYRLRVQPWTHCNQVMTRLAVKKKHVEMDSVIRQIQWLGLSQNRVLNSTEVRRVLDQLLGDLPSS